MTEEGGFVFKRSFLRWCVSFGVPKAFTSGDKSAFHKEIVQNGTPRLGMVHHLKCQICRRPMGLLNTQMSDTNFACRSQETAVGALS